MSKPICLRIHNKKEDGNLMRPGTPTPDKHWAWMLGYDLQEKCEGFYIGGGEDGPEIHITRDFKNKYPYQFIRIMQFAKLNKLTATETQSECIKCSGHPSCLAGKKDV